MKKLVWFVFVMALCLIPYWTTAQSVPAWLNPNVRELSYPQDVYFSEFSQGNLRKDESVSSLLERLKMDVKRGAAGNIRTMTKPNVRLHRTRISIFILCIKIIRGRVCRLKS